MVHVGNHMTLGDSLAHDDIRARPTEARQGFIFTRNFNENELKAFTYGENPTAPLLTETTIA